MYTLINSLYTHLEDFQLVMGAIVAIIFLLAVPFIILIWVDNRVSLRAIETIWGKLRFEKWLWEKASAEISHYHSNNGVFFGK